MRTRTRKRAYHSEEKEEKISSKFSDSITQFEQPGKRQKKSKESSFFTFDVSYGEQVNTTRRRRKRDCNSSLALINCPMGDEGRINSKIFVTLLRDVSTGGLLLGDPGSQGFWTKFADMYNSMDAGMTVTAESCLAFSKSLYRLYNIMTNHLNPEEEQQFKEKCQMHVGILAEIYKYQPSLGPNLGSPTQVISTSSGVPETPPDNTDMVVWNEVQSSGSSLKPELERGLQTMLYGLLKDGMLNLRDVADAETYLHSSTWASNMLLHSQDPKTVSDMIINARMDVRGENAQMDVREEKKKKRKMISCKK